MNSYSKTKLVCEKLWMYCHLECQRRMTIPVIIEWIFRRKWALSMTNDFSHFISD